MNVVAVVPLKPVARAKSRLGLDAATRSRLAEAFAADVLAGCRAAPGIHSIRFVGSAPPGADEPPVPDPGGGLNAALSAAAAGLQRTDPDDRVLALMGDLPCATAADLSALVSQAELAMTAGGHPGAFVCDAAGTGTTCLYARARSFQPGFGLRSRARHRSRGYVELTDPRWRALRRDVDALPDLWDALRLGVGPATREAVAATVGRPPPRR
jgi:2-phospho-L-lactate guanylyltransferase